MADLPSESTTFLFTDIEGGTRLRESLGERYADVLVQCRRFLRLAVFNQGGREIDAQGDACVFAFTRARAALTAAVAALRSIHRHRWPTGVTIGVKMGLHSGERLRTDTGYLGPDIHRAAHVCSVGHGGQILLSQPVQDLVSGDLPAGMSLRDLGEHRLRDLGQPERLYQVVEAGLSTDFPPLNSLNVLPNNLPIQLTSFIGREREIGEVTRLLATTRLLTLTGTGGVGKTRLAYQIAAEMVEDFGDGAWLVGLASLADPSLVAKAVASTLGVYEQPGRPLTATLADYLRAKSLLLLLDNCEHLLAATAQLADTLLRSCANVRILATSRERLGIAGELTYRVPSLSLPDPTRLPSLEHLLQYETVRLFAARAAFSESGFEVTRSNAAAVTEVCNRLDGIPLAIELAAARVNVLAVDQIASRLDDRFTLLTGGSRTALLRHQTLRGTMDWSYELLAERERALLRRLSVFASGWTLEAAEAICAGKDVAAEDVLGLLTRLVDKSLVVVETRHGESRYQLLETVRQYARDRLEDAAEATAVRDGHLLWYMQFAERADPGLRGPHQRVWLERLESDHANLRTALQWSKSAAGGAEAEMRLAAALWWFWYARCHWSEGRSWLEDALSRRLGAPPSAVAKAARGAVILTWRLGDYSRAARLAEESLTCARDAGVGEEIAFSLLNLGLVALYQHDYRRATTLTEDALALCREQGSAWNTSMALAQLGAIVRTLGDYGKAAALYEESLALSKEAGDKWISAYAIRNFGIAVLHQRNYGRAAALFTESLLLCGEVGDRWVTDQCLEGLAHVACAQGQFTRAARLYGAAEALRKSIGSPRLTVDKGSYDEHVASLRARLGEAAFAVAWAEGQSMTLEQAVAYAVTPSDTTPPRTAVKEKLRPTTQAGLLTSREREVATLVARGLTNRGIALQLVVTERTAETHVQNILNKLGFTSRAQIAAWTAEHFSRVPTQTPAQNFLDTSAGKG